jgi:uncharacterized protein
MWLVGCLAEGLVTMAILVGTAIAWESFPARWWLVGVAGVLVLGYAVVVPRWRYLVHRWEVSESAVYTQTGWWARERRIAPMSRIQTVDYAEGALSRLFGLATVTVTTASAAGALQIEGLDKTLAQQLVDELTLKADAVEGDAT